MAAATAVMQFPTMDFHETGTTHFAAAPASGQSQSASSSPKARHSSRPKRMSSPARPSYPARISSLHQAPSPPNTPGEQSAASFGDSMATFSSITPSQSASQAGQQIQRQNGRGSLDVTTSKRHQGEASSSKRATESLSYRNLEKASLSTPELHLSSDPLGVAENFMPRQRPKMGALGDPNAHMRARSTDNEAPPRASNDGIFYSSFAAAMNIVADHKQPNESHQMLPGRDRKVPNHRQSSRRERKQSTATVKKGSKSSDAASTLSDGGGSTSSSATVSKYPQDTSASGRDSTRDSEGKDPSKQSVRSQRKSTDYGEEQRHRKTSDASLKNPMTWFRKRRSSHNNSESPALSSDASPAFKRQDGDELSYDGHTEISSSASAATAGSGSTFFTQTGLSTSGTATSLGVDGSATGLAALENMRTARAFLVEELGQMSSEEMGGDKPKIASLAWYVREQEAETRGVRIDPLRETLEFWMSLSDGILLCLLLNKLKPGSIANVDRRDMEWVKADNISRFLRAARDSFAVRSKDLFHPLDLTDATAEGLARAVHTLLAVQRISKAYGLTSRVPRHSSHQQPHRENHRWSSNSMAQSTVPSSPSLEQHDQNVATSDVPFPKGSPRSSPSKRDSAGFRPAQQPPRRTTGPMWTIQQQREEAERILVAAAATPAPLYDDAAVVSNRRRRSSDVGGSLLAATKPKGGASITFADSVSRSSDEEQSRVPYRDRKLSESAISLTGVAEEETEEVIASPAQEHRSRMQAGPSSPTLERIDSLEDDGSGANFPGSNSSASAVGAPPTPSYTRGSPMARSSSQRRISLELNLGNNGSPRAMRGSSDSFDDSKFPISASPVRQTPVRRHSARSGAVTSNLNPQRDAFGLTGSESAATLSDSGFAGSPPGVTRVPFPRTYSMSGAISSAGESPSVKRGGRQLSLSGAAGTSTDSVNSMSNGGSGVTQPRHPSRPANFRHLRYSSDLNLPRSPTGISSKSDLFSNANSGDEKGNQVGTGPLSPSMVSGPSRSRFDSEHGSLYTNTLGSFSNEDTSSLGGARLGRESSVAPASKHKLVVTTEEGKPNVTYQMGNCIGRGQFGSVYRALNLNSGQMVAVKRIKLQGRSEDEVTQLMNEVDLLQSLAHPSVVKYEGLVRGPDVLSIILEYVENGSLLHTLKAFGNFPEKLVASYVVKILEGLNYLHEMKVVHCDLKAANILTTKNGNVKLSDFGVSLNLKAVENLKNDAIGTPNWMAPEVIELKGASPAADIWSLGCTIIELLTGKPPYGDMLAMSAMWRIVEDDCPPFPEKVSDPLRDFLTCCFQKDPSLRPSAEMLFEHEWLAKTFTGHKELRPQDSVPFLRRISADFRKVDAKSLQRALQEAAGSGQGEVNMNKDLPADMVVEEDEDASPTSQSPMRRMIERSSSSPSNAMAVPRPNLISMRASSAPDAWSQQLREIIDSSGELSPASPPHASSTSPAPMSPLAAAAAAATVGADGAVAPGVSNPLAETGLRRGSDGGPSLGSFDIARSPSMAASNSGERHVKSPTNDPSLLDLNSPDLAFEEPQQSKAHAFVKSTFSKAVQCKICKDPVKKHAVLCEDCGLICHASCARRASTPCNLRAQLLMFAGHRPSTELPRGASPAPSLAMSVNGTSSSSPVPPSPGTTPPFGPTIFRFPFGKNKRNSRGSNVELPSTIQQAPVSPTTPTLLIAGGVGNAPTSPTTTPTKVDREGSGQGQQRRRRISLLPSRARSPSPSPLPAPLMTEIQSPALSQSIGSSRSASHNQRHSSSISYGSVSGSSSLSSASNSGLAMVKTASTSSRNGGHYEHANGVAFAPVQSQPRQEKKHKAKQLSVGAALSTPSLSMGGTEEEQMKNPQHSGGFRRNVRRLSTGLSFGSHPDAHPMTRSRPGERSNHHSNGMTTPTWKRPGEYSTDVDGCEGGNDDMVERRRSRRASGKSDCIVM